MRNKKLYKLTHPQKRIWFIEKIYPGTTLYNIGGFVHIYGKIDFACLEKALHLFVKNTDALRLRLVEENNVPMQYVSPYREQPIDYFDFSKQDHPGQMHSAWVKNTFREPFQLIDHQLYYFAMAAIDEKYNGYLIKFHHITWDGWSVQLLTHYVTDTYNTLLKGDPPGDSMDYSYLSYIEKEDTYLQSGRFIKNKEFWNNKFRDLPELKWMDSSDALDGNRKTFYVEESWTKKIKLFSSENKISLNTFFTTVFLIFLHRYYFQKELIVGIPVFNRIGRSSKRTAGMFTSIIPLRVTLRGDMSFMETITFINADLGKCFINQQYPYDLLLQDLNVRKAGYDTLFKFCVNYYFTNHPTKVGGNETVNEELYNGNQIYSLQLVIKEWMNEDTIMLHFDYKTDDYTENEIEYIYSRIQMIVEQVINNTTIKISDLSMVEKDEADRLIYTLNEPCEEYQSPHTVISLFQERVRKHPDAMAVECHSRSVTFKELDAASNAMAYQLKQDGITGGTIAAIIMDHSIELMVSILAVLKTGAAYLAIDPLSPVLRIKYMCRDANAKVVLTNNDTIPIPPMENIIIHHVRELEYNYAKSFQSPAHAGDTAYVLYTSGSTGNPKGVVVTHKNLVNYIWWAKEKYIKNTDDVFALYTSLAFDLTVTSLFTPLISGTKIIIYPHDESEYVLYKIIRENKVTIIKLTPSHLSLLADMDMSNSRIRRFIVGGEDFTTKLAKKIYNNFKGEIELINEYGPTEATVGCMIHSYTPRDNVHTSVPIGIPAEHSLIYVLDPYLQPVPRGRRGEIYISGAGVAGGYLNNDVLTEEKFIDDPFFPGKKMYRSGDMGKIDGHGLIHFLGRIDEQIKIRGHRLEVKEIEKHLLEIDHIKDAAVVYRETDNHSGFLTAYLIAPEIEDENEVKNQLNKSLPEYALPHYFVFLNEFPLTINGKINKKELPLPSRSHGMQEYCMPRTPGEKKLTHILQSVLGMDKIGLHDNFYDLGGDSIKAILISSQLRNSHYQLSVRDILDHPVIRDMTHYMSEESSPVMAAGTCTGEIENTPILSWFLSRGFTHMNHYNQSVLLEVHRDIDAVSLRAALHELMCHHDTLRLNFDAASGTFYYNEHYLDTEHPGIIEFHDLGGLPPDTHHLEVIRIGNRIKSSLHMAHTPLMRCAYMKTGIKNNLLLITCHHTIIDGISWRILLEDLETLLKQGEGNYHLPGKTHSYQQWSRFLKGCKNTISRYEIEYWESILGKETGPGLSGEVCALKDCHTVLGELDEASTNTLRYQTYSAYNVHTDDILIIALLLSFQEFFGLDEMVMELESHGRNMDLDGIDISRTVGWFTSIFPAYFQIKGSTLPEKIISLKEQIRGIPSHGFHYGIYRFMGTDPLSGPSRQYVRFNYLGDFDAVGNGSVFSIVRQDTGDESARENILTSLMDINSYMIHRQLVVEISFGKSNFKIEKMKKFADAYMQKLRSLIMHCSTKTTKEYTPSDFETVEISQDELDNIFT